MASRHNDVVAMATTSLSPAGALPQLGNAGSRVRSAFCADVYTADWYRRIQPVPLHGVAAG